jgi:DNA polymerase-3 subunit epsilon
MSFLPFVAVDVETANLNNANICQFGFAYFHKGVFTGKGCVLVNPKSSFNPKFSALHGITHASISNCPTWFDVCVEIGEVFDNPILLSHTYFDREAITKACIRYELPIPNPKIWLDTCAIARRVWPEMRNHKLPTLAECFGIHYVAHDAGEDARCAGEIFLRAIADTGRTMVEFLEEHMSRESGSPVHISLEGSYDPEQAPLLPPGLKNLSPIPVLKVEEDAEDHTFAWIVFFVILIVGIILGIAFNIQN